MPEQVTFIGNGNMALSIARGLKERYAIEVIGRSRDKLDAFEAALGVPVTKKGYDQADIEGRSVLLCVKPANLEEVGPKLRGKAEVLYSVLAGTTLDALRKSVVASAYVRTMPNLAASVGASMTTLTGESARREEAEALFGVIGPTLWLDSEKELDIATALAGSGPAFLALAAEALCDGAVKQGLKRSDATALMRGLFKGFAELIQHEHPALLKEAVMSPGGTTAAGCGALEEAGARHAFIAAVESAYKKTRS